MKIKNILKKSLVVTMVMGLILSTGMLKVVQAADSWTILAPMSITRTHFQTEQIGGKIYAIGGIGTNVSNTVEVYDPATNKWTNKAPMSISRRDFESVVINNKIYVIGGRDAQKVFNSVEEYDPTTDKWTTKASMSTNRVDFQAEIINEKIYVSGGYSLISISQSFLSTVEEYDPTTDKWTTKAPMSTPRCWHETEVVNGKMYAFGGRNGNTELDRVEQYDPVSNTWTTKTPMFVRGSEFETVVVDGKIYLSGGVNSGTRTSEVRAYDTVTNSWERKTPMSTARLGHSIAILGGKIYAIGGVENSTFLDSIEEYDLVSNKWVTKAPMSTTRATAQAQIIGGKIYAIGGQSKEGYLASVEAYTALEEPELHPTLTVTPSDPKVKVGQEFTTTIAVHNVTNICAEDIKLTYDAELFEYIGAEAKTGLKIINEDKSVPGTIRFVVTSLGKDNVATGDKDLISLKFKAKKPGEGKVDITKGRIADNVSLEMDVAEANCGEAIITVEASKDVNRSGEVTLLDLGIAAGYYGMNAADTDITKYDADAVVDGKIDDSDLMEINKDMLANKNYTPNNL